MSHAPLHPDTRSLLSREILKAREAAEEGARASLAALRVGEATPAEGMTPAERSLRNRLRAHGRQLGDIRSADGKQDLGSLVEEIAYQHWHRMLFARFLAENGLLREDQGDQPIDLEECAALAYAKGLDIWAYAARCAQKMLPGIFRVDDPKFELYLDTPRQLELNAILKGLPSQVFTATDALGWVYQYWQEQRKAEVNKAMKSGLKAGAKELSPVTQLFTEDYMVDFLLHNTLGAWWAGKMGPITAADEAEARAKVGLPAKDGLPAVVWTYLRFAQDAETKKWTPAAGTFEGWPKKAKEITFLDPCMGSGHFPAFALPLLARMRMEEEGGGAAANLHAVLKDQIHGLELDQRCCQIGAFNLALTAWKLGGFQQLPALNVACCGIAPRARLADWVELAGGDERLKAGMSKLHKLFDQASVLGSLINPSLLDSDLFSSAYNQLSSLLDNALSKESSALENFELAVSAKGIATASQLLRADYVLVATNVPYLVAGKQDEVLKKYCADHHNDSKADLATAFLERCIQFSRPQCGTVAAVSPQSWLFLGTFRDFRAYLLQYVSLNQVVRLGPRAFDSISGEVVNVVLTTFSRVAASPRHIFSGIDVSGLINPKLKALGLQNESHACVDQSIQNLNPDMCIQTEVRDNSLPLLGVYADVFQGVGTTDNPRYVSLFWESPAVTEDWDYFQFSPEYDRKFSGFSGLLRWERGEGALSRIGTAHKGLKAAGKTGFAVSVTGGQKLTRFLGYRFDNTIAVIHAKNRELGDAVWAYLSSELFKTDIKALDRALSITESSFLKVPFDVDYWTKIAAEKYPNGLPKPFSSDPTQWLFNGHPHNSDNPLQVAVARMLGYQWPRQTGSEFPDCPALGPDGLEKHHDDDGVVPLSSINREETAATRLRALLKDAYGSEWNPATTEKELLASLGHADLTLEEWLQDEFFAEHCKLFHHRPFIWHIWDGAKDGFHVLVNYHRLAAGNGDGTRLLQKIATTYLGDWIARCTQDVAADKPGAARRLQAAQELQVDLRKILEGEAPHDIFVRWKPLHEQPIGWEPDINDGVRLNIRPFLTVRDVAKKGAGILRFKPNIKWDKDRGKEPERPKANFPWFWSCDPESNPQHKTDFTGGSSFTGERWNNLHYTLAAKKAARTKKA
jgi:hypothetical protein